MMLEHQIHNFGCFFLRYFGDRKEKPKIVCLSMMGLGLASCIMLLPQFITPPSTDPYRKASFNSSLDMDFSFSDLLCQTTSNNISNDYTLHSTTPDTPTHSNPIFNNMKYFFYLANLINGVSSVALYTIVITYIESLFNKEQV